MQIINIRAVVVTPKKARQEGKMSDEKRAQRKSKGYDSSWNPLRFKKNQKETGEHESLALRVNFESDSKPPPTCVFSNDEDTSEIITPVSAHALKLLEAIREDKLEFVEEELGSMNKQDIDKTDSHGFALIHVAARYNLHRIVTTLFEHGADVNIGTSEYRWIPLHLAARCVSCILQCSKSHLGKSVFLCFRSPSRPRLMSKMKLLSSLVKYNLQRLFPVKY